MNGILLADEQLMFLKAMDCLIGSCLDGVEVLDYVTDGSELESKVAKNDLYAVIMNIKLPNKDGISQIEILKKKHPNLKLIVLTEYDNIKFVKTAFQAGVDAYLLKTNSHEELVHAFSALDRNEPYLGNGVSIGPLGKQPDPTYEYDWNLEDAFHLKNHLTKREYEILEEIANEKNNKEIAAKLFISDQTVSAHRKSIMRKFNVNNTNNLIQLTSRLNILNS